MCWICYKSNDSVKITAKLNRPENNIQSHFIVESLKAKKKIEITAYINSEVILIVSFLRNLCFFFLILNVRCCIIFIENFLKKIGRLLCKKLMYIE